MIFIGGDSSTTKIDTLLDTRSKIPVPSPGTGMCVFHVFLFRIRRTIPPSPRYTHLLLDPCHTLILSNLYLVPCFVCLQFPSDSVVSFGS